MRTIYLLLFPITCWLFFSVNVYSQTLTYEVFKGNSKIGEMKVDRQYANGTWHYSSVCDVEVSFVVTVKVKSLYEATFKNNILQRSMMQNIRDGKVREASKGRRVGSEFITDVNGEPQTLNANEINYSILSSYYEEPTGRKRIFSERWGQLLQLKNIGSQKYALVLPNGDENYMTYQQGICTELQINHTLATLVFKLKNSLPVKLISEE
jgi:hypothetical protein